MKTVWLIVKIIFAIFFGILMSYSFVKGDIAKGCLDGFLWLYWMINLELEKMEV